MHKALLVTYLSFLVLLMQFGNCLAADPRVCIQDVAAAIDEADVELFKARVDVDAVLKNAIQVFLQEINKPQLKQHVPPMLALMLQQAASNEAVGASIRQLLLTETRAFVLNGIASGAFAGKKLSNSTEQGLLTPLFANASLGRKEIVQIGSAQQCPDGWIVPFVVYDYGNELEYSVDGLVQNNNGSLRLMRIVNLEALIAQIQEEAKQFN
ncbi:MAG: hypothetical protein IJU79_03420 [Desulfovibrionaceae bacterium]|nr:hypothetical protein [Desulfovibrionaceae bacterium]